jgi:hypothetical protein
MKIKYFFTLLFIICTSITFSQDCNCKYWKRTYYNINGEVRYEYAHKCSQPGSTWEYLGYDESYCNELIEDEKRRIEDIKKTNEAIEISKNTKKQINKEGYKVIAWYGKNLGNTGKWDEVGSPRFGINEDSTFTQWDENGRVVIRGHIKNKRLLGLLEFYENGNEYLDPTGLFKFIREYLQIETPWSWKPDVIYFNETEKYESEKNSLTKGVEQTFYGIYFSKINGQKKYYSHYYIKDGYVTLFSSPIDEKKASLIHNEIKNIEVVKELNLVKEAYKSLGTKIDEKISLKSKSFFEFENKKGIDLTESELNFIGTWNFNSNYVIDGDFYKNTKEQIILNKDRTYSYEGELIESIKFQYPKVLISTSSAGIWEIKNNEIIFISNPPKEDLSSNNLIDLVSIRLKEKLIVLDRINENNIKSNVDWLDNGMTLLKWELENNKSESEVFSALIFSLIMDEFREDNSILLKAKDAIFENEIARNIENTVKFDHLDAKKINRQNIQFNESFVYKLSEASVNHKLRINDQYGNINFVMLKGKKQK